MHHTKLIIGATLAGALVALGNPLAAAELPKATMALLAKLNLRPSILSGLDNELKVPAAWIAGAKKEGQVKIVSTFTQRNFVTLAAPFRARYPFIKIIYARRTFQGRTTRVILAYKANNYIADVVTAFSSAYTLYKKAGMLADMRNLPGFNNLEAELRGKDGTWAAHRMQFWCTVYNTNLVNKADLPKTWDDLAANARRWNKKIGVANRPQLWVLMLWGAKGGDWTKAYLSRFFARLAPQFRKEGLGALVSLTVAGEFDMAIPASQQRVLEFAAKGAPIGFHCPEPVPMSVATIGLIKGTPRPNAARLFVNWLLSKEGQIAQFQASHSVPAHKDLQRKEFLPFADEILGKKTAPRTMALLIDSNRAVRKIWDNQWAAGTGLGKMRTIDMTISSVKKRGRRLTLGFKVGGKKQSVGVSGRRTKITVKGKRARRSKLKTGMNCALTYRGDGDEAKSIACK